MWALVAYGLFLLITVFAAWVWDSALWLVVFVCLLCGFEVCDCSVTSGGFLWLDG